MPLPPLPRPLTMVQMKDVKELSEVHEFNVRCSSFEVLRDVTRASRSEASLEEEQCR